MDANVWPWRIRVTKADGTSPEQDYSEEFAGRPITELARHLSAKPGVVRVDLVTSFVAGEQVSPGSATVPLDVV